MAIKTHLADSEIPLIEGSKLLAICGAIVPDAAFVMMFDEEFYAGGKLNVAQQYGICRNCRAVLMKPTSRYMYCIRSGEDQKHSLRGHSTE